MFQQINKNWDVFAMRSLQNPSSLQIVSPSIDIGGTCYVCVDVKYVLIEGEPRTCFYVIDPPPVVPPGLCE